MNQETRFAFRASNGEMLMRTARDAEFEDDAPDCGLCGERNTEGTDVHRECLLNEQHWHDIDAAADAVAQEE